MKKILLLLLTVVALAACAAPATPIPPTQVLVAPKPTIASSAPASSSASSVASSTANCATTDAAPLDKFRADDPAKFAAATGKPKLVEFFAYW